MAGSLYRQIAIDIAKNIVNGKYVKDDYLYGRSVLASYYKVSPETVRKAVYILKDVGIVDIIRGVGVKIVSAEKARNFLSRNEDVMSLSLAKKEVKQWVKKQSSELDDVLKKIEFIISETEKINTAVPLNPFQVRITGEAAVLGKNLTDLDFWQNTGATVVAVRRGEELIISPGPYFSLLEDDYLFFVGDEASYNAALNLLFG